MRIKLTIPRFVQAIENYFFGMVPPYPLSAFRILFGGFLLFYFGSYCTRVEALFSSQGVYTTLLIPDNWALPPLWAYLLYFIFIAVTVAFTIGWRTRVMTPLLLVLYLYYFFLNFATNDATFDRLIPLILLVLCFGEMEKAWAVSSPKGAEPPLICAWPMRVIALQESFVYFGTGVYKLYAPDWQTGEVLTHTFMSVWSTPASFWFMSFNWPAWFYTLLAQSVIAFEISCAFGLYIPRVQRVYFVLGTLFHISIWVMMNIPQFLLCATTYVLYANPASVKKLGEQIQALIHQGLGRLCDRIRPDEEVLSEFS